MKRLFPLFALCLGPLVFTSTAQEAVTTPVGAVTVTIAAGSGSAKVRTPVSVPLLDSASITGSAAGRLTGVTASSLSCAGAGWQNGALSQLTDPYVVRITSGAATGMTFLISSQTPNTSETLTIDSGDASFVNLTNLGIVTGSTTGDTFQIIPCDTISEIFGTPATTGVLGGTSAAVADTIVLNTTFGLTQTFYFNTSLNRWARQAIGNPDATHTTIRPDSGILYFRLAASPLTLTFLGSVPSTDRKALVKNAGITYLANSWPVPLLLTQCGLQSLPGWLTSSSANSADIVTIGTSNYFYDGTNWRRQAIGSPISNPSIAPGSSITVEKRGVTSGASVLQQAMLYTLE